MGNYKYKRILLKLSGEALQGEQGYGIDPKVISEIASQIAQIVDGGVELAITVGGGNIFRGLAGAAGGMERAQADYMGMLATVMNALALQEGSSARASTRACNRRSACRRSPNPTFAARPFAISRRARRHIRGRHG